MSTLVNRYLKPRTKASLLTLAVSVVTFFVLSIAGAVLTILSTIVLNFMIYGDGPGPSGMNMVSLLPLILFGIGLPIGGTVLVTSIAHKFFNRQSLPLPK